jgi:phosphate-selective porin OprO/OprP
MGRTAAAAFLAVLLAAGSAGAGEGTKTETERRLEEVLAELEAQRARIADLRARMEAGDGGSVDEAVKRYLESEEGKKALGRGPGSLQASWKDGLQFESADRAFTLQVGGRLMLDFVAPSADDEVESHLIPATGAAVGDFDPTAGVRRMQLALNGTIHESLYYAVTLEFAQTPNQFKDAYIGFKGLPGNTRIQVGYMKEPAGLEELTSSRYITFAERSLANNAFAPAQNLGVMLLGSVAEERIHWAVGDFTEHAASGVGAVQFQHGITARLCGTPLQDAASGRLLHVGASVQDRSPEAETDRVRVRPSVPFLPRTQDTGTFSVDSEWILGLEGALRLGPLSFQGETYRARYDDHPDAPGPSPEYRGWYGMVSWFATGESRPYRGGSFGRVKPKNSVKGSSGTGAVELAARWSALDLYDDGLDAGTGQDLTLGVNWYLNPNARLMLNYVMYELRHVGDVNSVVVRFQIDF